MVAVQKCKIDVNKLLLYGDDATTNVKRVELNFTLVDVSYQHFEALSDA